MKRILALAILLTATAAWAQYTPPAGAAYIYSGGVWTGAPSTGTLGALSYTPPAIALYCLNGSGQWVPADASCFGGGLPLTGGTLTGPLTGTSATFSGTVAAGTATPTTIGSSGVLLNGVPALQSQTSLNNYYSGGAGNLTGTGN